MSKILIVVGICLAAISPFLILVWAEFNAHHLTVLR